MAQKRQYEAKVITRGYRVLDTAKVVRVWGGCGVCVCVRVSVHACVHVSVRLCVFVTRLWSMVESK